MTLPKITLQVGNNDNHADDDDDNDDNNRDRYTYKNNYDLQGIESGGNNIVTILLSLGYFQFLCYPCSCIILGCLTNLDEFIAKLPEEAKFTPMGELLHSYKCSDVEYEIYKVIFYYLCLSHLPVLFCNFSLSNNNSIHML